MSQVAKRKKHTVMKGDIDNNALEFIEWMQQNETRQIILVCIYGGVSPTRLTTNPPLVIFLNAAA